MDFSKFTFLGFANGWSKTPDIVKEAYAKGYEIKSCPDRFRGVAIKYCEELNFYYKVDSTD